MLAKRAILAAAALTACALTASPMSDQGDEAMWCGDYAAARQFYEQGVAANDPVSMNQLACALREGTFGKVERDRASELLARGVALNEKWCLYNTALNLRSGDGCKRDPKKAQELFDKARAIAEKEFAEAASADAAYLLGSIYAGGDGVEADARKAMKFYGEVVRSYSSVPKGDRLDASLSLIALMDDAMEDYGQGGDTSGAIRILFAKAWIEALSAPRDNPEAMAARALLYLAKGNEKVAQKWARRAHAMFLARAENGDVSAMVDAGLNFIDGDGCERDMAAGERWLRKAAGLGDAKAKTELARLVMEGNGTAKDPAAAVKLFQEAAAAGDSDAMMALAVCSLQGIACKPDRDKALEYLQLAADCGDQFAREMLEMEDPLEALPPAPGGGDDDGDE